MRYVARPCRSRYGLVLGFLALGLMAKPMLVTVPFVLLLLDYWPLGRLEEAKVTYCSKDRKEKKSYDAPVFVFSMLFLRTGAESLPFPENQDM